MKIVIMAALSLSFFSTENLTIAQINEFKITASDGAAGDWFGYSVSISGDYAVVGALWDDDNGADAGSAYLYKRNDTSWAQEAQILASDGTVGDNFGYSVSISGDYVVVGAISDDAGSAYVFKRTGTIWTQEAKLLASDGTVGDNFGVSISISGDYIVVGANGDDDNGGGSGSAYVFKRTGTNWAQEAKLLAADGVAADQFGFSISISGDYAVVGAAGHSGGGAAYVYKRTGTSWAEEAKLLASDGGGWLGFSVSIAGDYTVVGANGHSGGGAAYVYKRDGTSWEEEAILLASDRAIFDAFGTSVSILGDYVVTGAYQNDDNGNLSGSAYLYQRFGTSWVQQSKLLPSEGMAGDRFGVSISMSANHAIVGAYNSDDNGTESGSAYMYNGFIPNDPTFVLNPIQDVVADEDFGSIMVALLDTVFDDPNLPNDSLRYAVSVSSGLVTANIAGDSLRLFSVGHLYGMAEVVVTATDDSSASVSDSFTTLLYSRIQ